MKKNKLKQPLRDVFGNHLLKIGKKNKKICVVSCDLKGATKTIKFLEHFKRSFEAGIAEQMVSGLQQV